MNRDKGKVSQINPKYHVECESLMSICSGKQNLKSTSQLRLVSVARIKVQHQESHGNNTRYEVRVLDSFKTKFTLLQMEYLWSSGRCHCPRLLQEKEYIVMGNLVADNETRESRLEVNKDNFVRGYNKANAARLRTLKNKVNCDRFG